MTASNSSSRPEFRAIGQVSEANEIEGFDAPSLTALIARLERSHTLEHLVYREAELDEIWRMLDGALRDARRKGGEGGEAAALLESLKTMIFKVHDLVGVDEDPQAAAVELRAGLFLTLTYST